MPKISQTVERDGASELIRMMDKPICDALDLSRALIMAISGTVGAGFDEEDSDAALVTLARALQIEIERSHELWERAAGSGC